MSDDEERRERALVREGKGKIERVCVRETDWSGEKEKGCMFVSLV